VILSDRFVEALAYAHSLHKRQRRKGTQIPYISHLLSVSAIVMEAGGDEEEAIAALLHDAVEDQGGESTLEEIRRIFGERVAGIVQGCSDSLGTPKQPWKERKLRFLEVLESAPPGVQRVALADKVHNARTILFDLRQEGPRVWKRFKGGKPGTLWYYNSLVEVFTRLAPGPLTQELARVVEEIHELSNGQA
jgi:(p)ppGpp synthase/HD superfamily hydrolase